MSTPIFDATQVAPQTERTAWPKGRYKVMVASTEVKPSSSGNGTVLSVGFRSMEGPTQGQTLKTSINWKNENPQAQEIGRSELSALCHAVKVLKPLEFSNFHGIALCIDVDTREVEKTHPQTGVKTKVTYNDVKGYRYADGEPIVVAVTSPAAPLPSTPPPQWAAAMAPEPAPPVVPVQPPAPEPVTPSPFPPISVPPTTTPTEKLYYVANTTGYLAEQPINLMAIKAMNLVMAEIKVCEAGSTEWIAGDKAFPPWLMGK